MDPMGYRTLKNKKKQISQKWCDTLIHSRFFLLKQVIVAQHEQRCFQVAGYEQIYFWLGGNVLVFSLLYSTSNFVAEPRIVTWKTDPSLMCSISSLFMVESFGPEVDWTPRKKKNHPQSTNRAWSARQCIWYPPMVKTYTPWSWPILDDLQKNIKFVAVHVCLSPFAIFCRKKYGSFLIQSFTVSVFVPIGYSWQTPWSMWWYEKWYPLVN